MGEFTVECRRCGRTMRLIGPIEIDYIDECAMCNEARVSLPKRGDRVRVTEARSAVIHHCPRSNWTGPESDIRKGICPGCAGTTLYEDCSATHAVQDASEVNAHLTARAEFARGMRRAVEIAEGLCARDDAFYHLANEMKEAVEKELADG